MSCPNTRRARRRDPADERRLPAERREPTRCSPPTHPNSAAGFIAVRRALRRGPCRSGSDRPRREVLFDEESAALWLRTSTSALPMPTTSMRSVMLASLRSSSAPRPPSAARRDPRLVSTPLMLARSRRGAPHAAQRDRHALLRCGLAAAASRSASTVSATARDSRGRPARRRRDRRGSGGRAGHAGRRAELHVVSGRA